MKDGCFTFESRRPPGGLPGGPSLGLAISLFTSFRIVVETHRNPPRIDRNRCVPVGGYRAGYFRLGLAQLLAQIRFEIEDFWPDP